MAPAAMLRGGHEGRSGVDMRGRRRGREVRNRRALRRGDLQAEDPRRPPRRSVGRQEHIREKKTEEEIALERMKRNATDNLGFYQFFSH